MLGHDVAGVVTGSARTSRDFKVGDEVYARPRDLRIGTFAEYIAIDQDDVALKPSLAHPGRGGRGAAGRPGRLAGPRRPRPRQAGPEGPRPRRLPAAWGRQSSSSPSTWAPRWRRPRRGENAELVRSLGADVVIDYTKEDFAEVLSGYDVVLDSLGGDNLEKSLTVLKPGGLAISVVGPPDPAFAKQVGAPTSSAS